MSETVIKVENVSKQYRLGAVGTGSLAHDINRIWYKIRGKEDPYLKIGDANDRASKAGSDYVWALQDINFEVQHGEVLGIIGRNGAGKSTLLKILSRTTSPTTGQIKMKGRVASLLEVGTGFHPELSGRENIFLNGAILGMTRVEIKKKFDEIVDFAGVERYIDTPVKRYSSGMYVRLAFGVAAHLEPEILIVDEVLAVGDAEFQKKALGKMKSVSKNEGRTVLFVSHNMAAISNLCTTGIILENGNVKTLGEISACINSYMQSNAVTNHNYSNEKYTNKDSIKFVRLHPGKNQGGLYSFEDKIAIEIEVYHPSYQINTHLGIALLDKWNKKIFTDIFEITMNTEKKNHLTRIMAIIPSHLLLSGTYSIDVALFIPRVTNFDYVSEACTFEVEDITSSLAFFSGLEVGSIIVKYQWEILD